MNEQTPNIGDTTEKEDDALMSQGLNEDLIQGPKPVTTNKKVVK